MKLNQFSPWTTVSFKLGRKRVKGICRFCLRSAAPEFVLYVSPINVHPEEPAVPIAYPIFFARWLAKRQGLFGTLGLMEDTWGRNEQALNDDLFLDQAWLTHREREAMFFSALERTRTGLCVGVFDASDRIQHMFWRYLDPKHPSPCETNERAKQAIPEMYRRMDDLLGRVRAKLNNDDILFVISDHGFASFRRCINLNTWLMQKGYLTLKSEGLSGRDYFRDVDWTRTRAFAVGLSGLYINREGRERHGIVPEAEAERLKVEIATKLTGLKDPQDGAIAIKKVYDTAREYRGLFSDEAPDLIVGYNPGYRVSWDSVTGGIEEDIFCDNVKAWSGDHHVNPEDIPGIFLSNRALKARNPHIVDLAPSILDLFSIPVPRYMEGKALI